MKTNKKRQFYTIFSLAFVLLGLSGAASSSVLTGLLLSLVIVIVAARIGGDIALRLGQPEVLGELIVGVLIGNLSLVGLGIFDFA